MTDYEELLPVGVNAGPVVIGGIAGATTLPLALGVLVVLPLTLPVSRILARATSESRVDV